MYNPYISYVDKYFPNAISVVDSFHVIQWITRMIDNYIRQLLKKFRQRDREYQDKLSYEQQQPVSLPPSDEVYLLQKFRWLILSKAYTFLSLKFMRDNEIFGMINELFAIYPSRSASKLLFFYYIYYFIHTISIPLA